MKVKALAIFLVLSLLARYGSFFISVINHDESTYIVIADELLRGDTYLVDVVDTKPIGIFLVYMGLIELTGGSIFALRMAAALVVGLGGWLIYRLLREVVGPGVGPWVGGGAYILACSVYKFYGVSPNTEIFFNLLTLAAVWVAVVPRLPSPSERKAPFWQWPLAGLLLGTGCVIKPFVAAEAVAIGLFALWYHRRAWGRALAAGAALLGGFIVPVGAVAGYYALSGLWEHFYFYTFTVASAYAEEATWSQRLLFMGDYLLRNLPFVILGGGALVQWQSKSGIHSWLIYLGVQFALVSVAVLLTGKQFGHYQVQLHPLLALWAGTGAAVWEARRSPPGPRRGRAAGRALAFASTFAFALGTIHHFYYRAKTDEPRIIADYLAPRLAADETLFMINNHQIVYHLLDRPVPTPYVHSSLMYRPTHRSAFGVDDGPLAARILAEPGLRYAVRDLHEEESDTPLRKEVLASFEPIDTLQGRFVVYYRP